MSYTVTLSEGGVREGRVLHFGRGARAGSDWKERGVSYTVIVSEGGVRQEGEGRVLRCDRERRRGQTVKRGACLTL